jgi:membrane protease YdiL (CAAX protease family)
MAIESVVFAVGLMALGRGFGPLLDHMGIVLSPRPSTPAWPLVQAITYVGAGIYEEMLFRLLLFGGIVWTLKELQWSTPMMLALAAVAASLVFACAHHAGPYGEPFRAYIFVFRWLAGLYFTLLYQLRGFGIVVGAHACYDVLAGILIA